MWKCSGYEAMSRAADDGIMELRSSCPNCGSDITLWLSEHYNKREYTKSLKCGCCCKRYSYNVECFGGVDGCEYILIIK